MTKIGDTARSLHAFSGQLAKGGGWALGMQLGMGGTSFTVFKRDVNRYFLQNLEVNGKSRLCTGRPAYNYDFFSFSAVLRFAS